MTLVGRDEGGKTRSRATVDSVMTDMTSNLRVRRTPGSPRSATQGWSHCDDGDL